MTLVGCGAITTACNSNTSGATLGGDIVAGLIGMAADAMVEEVSYTTITDL